VKARTDIPHDRGDRHDDREFRDFRRCLLCRRTARGVCLRTLERFRGAVRPRLLLRTGLPLRRQLRVSTGLWLLKARAFRGRAAWPARGVV